MSINCEGCSGNNRLWSPSGDIGSGIHNALVIAGSLTNAQRRTLKFEASEIFSNHTENACDIDISIGSKALLSFIYDEDRPMLALDTWKGRKDSSRMAAQMTTHKYNFNVLALDEATDKEIERRGSEKLYGLPIYIIRKGSMVLRQYDPDGSEVLWDIPGLK